MSKILDLLNSEKKIIAMWGYPDPGMLVEVRAKYPDHEIVDLDINYNAPSSNLLPDAYCKIIGNIVDNALYLRNKIELIIASVGEEKCDSARIAAKILADIGFTLVETKYTEYKNSGINIPISTSSLPLKDKIINIMDGIINPVEIKLSKSKPEYGFWGVPPNDTSVLHLFPDSTHVFGWIRCVEAKRPADHDLEMYVDYDLPTVFFAQTFCAKTQMAKYLARKYNGLYVDVDDLASNSVRAKIEAFIRLG